MRKTRKERRIARRAAAKAYKERNQLFEGRPYFDFHVDHLPSLARRFGAILIDPKTGTRLDL